MTIDDATTEKNNENRRRRRRGKSEAMEELIQEMNPGQTAPKDRPTPSRRDQHQQSRGNFITRLFRPITNYFADTRSELQKVTWPSRDESIRLSGIVIAVTIAFAIGLGLLDFLYGQLFSLAVNTPVIFLIAGVAAAVVLGGAWVYLRRRNT